MKTVLLASVVALASCKMMMPSTPDPQWVDFYSASSRHAAAFPQKPKASLKETVAPGGQKTFTYLQEVQADSRYFGTGWLQIPAAPADGRGRDRILDVAVDAAVKSTAGGKLIGTNKPVIDGIEGRSYTIDVPKDKLRLRQQIFVAGDGLVEQTYTGPAGTETDADAERFFGSLRLLP
jgi:hypothetical protein